MIPLAVLAGSDIAAIIGSMCVLAGVVLTGIVAFKSSQSTSAIGLVGTLNERLGKVEDELVTVKAELSKSNRVTSAAVRFIERLVDRLRDAGVTIPPAPEDLHEYLDPDLWNTQQQDQGPHPTERRG